MHLPRSPLISDDHFYISGDVTLESSAAIAPNVMLQADPGCKIIVAAGVSIGSGSILHAHGGNLEIDAGATLGSGVLILGSGKIGVDACIGSRATVLNSSIAPEYAVPPGAVIGDYSSPATPAPQSAPAPVETNETNGATPANGNGKKPVYGQVYLERMMVMMFPHQLENQKLTNPSPDD
jgi:carbon dioxide concentrating mechanism protein CcmN